MCYFPKQDSFTIDLHLAPREKLLRFEYMRRDSIIYVSDSTHSIATEERSLGQDIVSVLSYIGAVAAGVLIGMIAGL